MPYRVSSFSGRLYSWPAHRPWPTGPQESHSSNPSTAPFQPTVLFPTLSAAGAIQTASLQASQSASQLLRRHQLSLLRRLVLADIASHRARRHRQRAGQIHLSRPAAAREVAVLGADYHLIGTRRNPWPGVDAGPAAGLDHNGPRLLEHLQVALAHAVLARLLRPELNVELAAGGHPLALAQRLP